MGKLKRFKEASYDSSQSKKYEIICFDWQEEMVRKYVGNEISLLVITDDKLNNLITNAYS